MSLCLFNPFVTPPFFKKKFLLVFLSGEMGRLKEMGRGHLWVLSWWHIVVVVHFLFILFFFSSFN
jgi:hypothetical protein